MCSNSLYQSPNVNIWQNMKLLGQIQVVQQHASTHAESSPLIPSLQGGRGRGGRGSGGLCLTPHLTALHKLGQALDHCLNVAMKFIMFKLEITEVLLMSPWRGQDQRGHHRSTPTSHNQSTSWEHVATCVVSLANCMVSVALQLNKCYSVWKPVNNIGLGRTLKLSDSHHAEWAEERVVAST